MSKRGAHRTYPLVLVFTAHGTAELLNAHQEILWASDADEDFREEMGSDFLEEADIQDVLEFLRDNSEISEKEFGFFASEHWDVDIETLDQGEDDDDEESEDDDDEADDG